MNEHHSSVTRTLLGPLALLVLCAAAIAPPDETLIDAVRRGDAGAVAVLIQQGAEVDSALGDGMTALHWAAREGDLAVADVLLSAGADVDAETRIGSYTPLHLASRGGHGAVVRRLLGAGGDPNVPTASGGVTPLHLAAAAIGDGQAVTALLEHGADPNALETSAGQTPLMFAAAENRVTAIQALLAAGADASVSTVVVDVLKNVVTDLEAGRVFRLELAALREQQEGGGPDWMPTPRQVQAAIEVQRAFLRSGDAYGAYDPEQLVSYRPDYPGGPDLARPPYREMLVRMTGGMTALLHASREGHVEAATALLDGAADVNQVSGGDETSALLMAAINGQFDVALRLIERGADPNLVASTDGSSPLFAVLQTQWAPRSNYPQPRAQDRQAAEYIEVLRALLEAGADPNARLNTHLWYWEYGLTKIGVDLKGATPFWRATFAQDLGAMRILTDYGADPTIPTSWPAVGMRERRQQDGRQQEDSGLPWIPEDAPNAAPIHMAAGGGFTGLGSFSVRNVPNSFIPAVRYLIEELGADVNLRDSWGYTPIHYAAGRGDNDLIDYLVSQGGDVTVITRLGQSTADMARGGRAGFFTRVAYPETIDLLQGLGSTLECLHTHFLDTGDSCPLAGKDDPWRPIGEDEPSQAPHPSGIEFREYN
jgi:ankyrin repeat protein